MLHHQTLRGTTIVARRLSLHFTTTVAMSSYSGPKGPLPNDAKTGPKGEPMAPIPSASLVVLCPVSGNSSSGSSTRYATLMLQRSARDGSSFRSAVVFPGGALDLADEDAVQRMTQGNLSPCTNQGGDATEAAYIHSLRLCALRETFEETGLLLLPVQDSQSNKSRAIGPAEAGIEANEWKKLRDEIHNDARAFPPFLKRVFKAVSQSSSLDDADSTSLPPLAPMSHHSNWVTPRGVVRPAKRFDAHFFLTVLDKADALGPLTSASRSSGSNTKDLLDLSADGTETTSLTLATADEMIESTIRDKVVLFPPQFYILADLAATLKTKHTKDMNFIPLIFRHPTEVPNSNTNGVTPVEEEPRGLHPDSHYQFEKDSGKGGRAVTSVEPRAMPASGTNVNKSVMQWRGQVDSKETAEEDEQEPFVFPLVLPGDFLASGSQQAQMSGNKPLKSTNAELKPLNRVYVTPRSRKDGGGVIVRGARRRGLPGLIDFEEGAQLQEMGAEGLEEAKESRGGSEKAKL